LAEKRIAPAKGQRMPTAPLLAAYWMIAAPAACHSFSVQDISRPYQGHQKLQFLLFFQLAYRARL
jgi:hypothetical protein